MLGQWDILLLDFTFIGFTDFYLGVSSLIGTTSAFVKNKSSKMRPEKIRVTNGGQIKEEDVPST